MYSRTVVERSLGDGHALIDHVHVVTEALCRILPANVLHIVPVKQETMVDKFYRRAQPGDVVATLEAGRHDVYCLYTAESVSVIVGRQGSVYHDDDHRAVFDAKYGDRAESMIVAYAMRMIEREDRREAEMIERNIMQAFEELLGISTEASYELVERMYETVRTRVGEV